jgi:hypothetical protein
MRSFEFLLVLFISQAGIILLGEVNQVVTRLITRGVVVLRLQGFGSSDLEPDQCFTLRPRRSYHLQTEDRAT